MVYREPLTDRIIFDDFSYCVLIPFGGSIYIVSLLKNNQLTATNIKRIITNLKKLPTLKSLRKLIRERPDLIIYTVNLVDFLFFSQFDVVSKGPKLTLIDAYIMKICNSILQESHRLGQCKSLNDWKKIVIRSIIPTKEIVGYVALVISNGLELLLQQPFSKAILKYLLYFGNFTSSPLEKAGIILICCLGGSIIGYKSSQERSKFIAKVTFFTWLCYNVGKYKLSLFYYNEIGQYIRELRARGYSWERIRELLGSLYPEYDMYLQMMNEYERLRNQLKQKEVHSESHLIQPLLTDLKVKSKLPTLSANNNSFDAKQALEALGISDKGESAYFVYDKVISEPEVQITTYKFMASKSSLFRSSSKLKSLSSK